MKKLISRSINALSLLIFLAVSAAAQTPAPTPEKSVQTLAAPKMISLSDLPAGEKFTSEAGRFTIAMPKDGDDFEAIVPDEDNPKQTGGRHTWVVKEGVITIEYSDDPDVQVKTAKDYADLAEGMRAGIAIFNATPTSERAIKVGTYRGYEIVFEDAAELKGVSRMLIVGGRRYTLFYLSMPGYTGGPDRGVKALDSFALIAAKPAAAVKKPVRRPAKVTRKN